ncbi:MAG: hypothetical protein HW384_98 [Dehalococcoidia bacterium]|nr:hypothetical protein [Dehalococcoidia bacterium]
MKLLEARGERILGRIIMAQERFEDAEKHLKNSIALAPRYRGEYEKALALKSLAELYRLQPGMKRSTMLFQSNLNKAISIFRQLGAEIDLSQCTQMQAFRDR